MGTKRISPQQKANLRVCGICEWVFKGHIECPQCGFASYGARHVYGKKCYRYLKTQEPWKEKKLTTFSVGLDEIIRENVSCKKKELKNETFYINNKKRNQTPFRES